VSVEHRTTDSGGVGVDLELGRGRRAIVIEHSRENPEAVAVATRHVAIARGAAAVLPDDDEPVIARVSYTGSDLPPHRVCVGTERLDKGDPSAVNIRTWTSRASGFVYSAS